MSHLDRTEELQAAQRLPRAWEPYLCLIVLHELGHTAVLEHSETGVMAAQASDVPYDCRRWVHRRVQARRCGRASLEGSRRNPVSRAGSPR